MGGSCTKPSVKGDAASEVPREAHQAAADTNSYASSPQAAADPQKDEVQRFVESEENKSPEKGGGRDVAPIDAGGDAVEERAAVTPLDEGRTARSTKMAAPPAAAWDDQDVEDLEAEPQAKPVRGAARLGVADDVDRLMREADDALEDDLPAHRSGGPGVLVKDDRHRAARRPAEADERAWEGDDVARGMLVGHDSQLGARSPLAPVGGAFRSDSSPGMGWGGHGGSGVESWSRLDPALANNLDNYPVANVFQRARVPVSGALDSPSIAPSRNEARSPELVLNEADEALMDAILGDDFDL